MKTYSVGELRRVIKESADEFKPVMGTNVVKDNKKNNDQAYKDMDKQTKDYNGKLKYDKKDNANTLNFDYNKGMTDIQYNKDAIDKQFQDRVKSQMKGYTSVDNEKNHKDNYEGNAEYDGMDTKILSNHAKDNLADKEDMQQTGLQARVHPNDFKGNKKTIYDNPKPKNESKDIKRIHFKKTTFLGESHMISKIPEEFKINGNSFLMEDNSDNKYLVEWSNNKAYVKSYMNKNKLNEQIGKIKSLFDKSNDSKQQSSKDDKLIF